MDERLAQARINSEENGKKIVEDFDWVNRYKIRVRKGYERKFNESLFSSGVEVPDEGQKMRSPTESDYIDRKLTGLPLSNFRDLTAILSPEFRKQTRHNKGNKV